MKTGRAVTLATAALAVFATLSVAPSNSCLKRAAPAPRVYAAGWRETPGGGRVPVVWEDGVAVDLAGGEGEAVAVFCSGADVYAAGWLKAAEPGRISVATLWKNGVPQSLNGVRGYAKASSIFVSGSIVYVTGNEHWAKAIGTAFLWENGSERILGENRQTYEWELYPSANSVFVSGGVVYVAGGIGDEVGVWKNGVYEAIGPGRWAHSVFVAGGDVHVVGIVSERGGVEAPMLWKNGVRTPLPYSGAGGWANSVFVQGGDVFVAGHETSGDGKSKPILWKNGQAQKLPHGPEGGGAASVTVFGDDVYVAGHVGRPDEYVPLAWTGKGGGAHLSSAVIWKNGVPQKLGIGDENSRAYCVFVK